MFLQEVTENGNGETETEKADAPEGEAKEPSEVNVLTRASDEGRGANSVWFDITCRALG